MTTEIYRGWMIGQTPEKVVAIPPGWPRCEHQKLSAIKSLFPDERSCAQEVKAAIDRRMEIQP